MGEELLHRAIKISPPSGVGLDTEVHLSYPSAVWYAGGSHRRLRALRDLFPYIPVEKYGIDDEPRDPDVLTVMRYKVDTAHRSVNLPDHGIIMAADTRTKTPIFTGNQIVLESRGKPVSAEEVFETFQEMHRVSQVGIDGPHYVVDSASGLLHRNSRDAFFEMQDTTIVALHRDAVARLSTLNGFAAYLSAFREFYSELSLYPSHHGRMTISDLSAGISLPVLVKIGAVDTVDGVPRKSPFFYKALRHAIYTAAIGFSPELLELVGVTRYEVTSQWNWINSVTKRALIN